MKPELAHLLLASCICLAGLAFSAVLLFRFPRMNSAWLVAGAGLLGALRYALP